MFAILKAAAVYIAGVIQRKDSKADLSKPWYKRKKWITVIVVTAMVAIAEIMTAVGGKYTSSINWRQAINDASDDVVGIINAFMPDKSKEGIAVEVVPSDSTADAL